VLRAGDGSIPLRFYTLATVPRLTLRLRLANAPCMRVYPQPGFSGAMRAINAEIVWNLALKIPALPRGFHIDSGRTSE